MLQEMYFPPLNRHPKQGGTPVDEVEAWLDRFPQKRAENQPNGGIIRTSPNVQELFLRPSSKKERKAAIAKAKREHKEAMKNIAKQQANDAREIAKQLSIWRKEAEQKRLAKEKAEREKQKAAERAKQKAATKKKSQVKPIKKKSKRYMKPEPNAFDLMRIRVSNRRSELKQRLESGEHIEVISELDKASQAAYKMQFGDIKAITKDGLNIIKIRNISTGVSYLAVDKFARYETKPVEGTLDDKDTKRLMKAITSGQMLEQENIIRGVRTGARTMSKLATKYGMNIYTVVDGRHLIGWILIDKQ